MEEKEEFDWITLAEKDMAQSRSALDCLRMEEVLQGYVTQAEQAIKSCNESILTRAYKVSDYFMSQVAAMKRTEESSRMRVSIRQKPNGTVEIVWVRARTTDSDYVKDTPINPKAKFAPSFKIKTAKGLKKITVIYERLSKGRTSDRYPDSIFRKEPEWVKVLGPQVEDQLALLRKEQRALGMIRRYIKMIEETQKRFFDDELDQGVHYRRSQRKSVFSNESVEADDQ